MDRYGTACQSASRAYNQNGTGSIATVLMANGLPGHQSDALASPFLEQKLGAPILLDNGTSNVPQNTMTCLSTNKVKNVIMIGGGGSNGGTAATLRAAGYTVDDTTYAGTDRFDTGKRVDSAGGAAGTSGGSATGILASGDDNHLVDALGAGSMSFGDKFPILLTSSTGCTLPAATQQVITSLGIKKVIVVGGTAAVPACQYTGQSFTTDTAATTGANRAATARLLAQDEISNYGGSNEFLGLAGGATYIGQTTQVQNDGADALTSAPVLGNASAWNTSNASATANAPSASVVGTFIPLVVTNNPTDFSDADAQAAAEKPTLHGPQPVFGGTAVLPQSGVDGWITAMGGTPAQGGNVSSISPSSGPAGSTVTATVNGYASALSVSGCGLNNQSATPSSSNSSSGSTSTFTFTIPSAQSAGTCTLTFTATTPSGTQTSTQSFTVTAAGQTVRPQLLSASILKTVTAAQANSTNPQGTYVQYVFSQAIPSAAISPSGFNVYDSADDRYNCAACTATVDSANSNAVDVIFNQTAATTAATTSPASADLTTTSGAATLTLATVGGAQDPGGPAVTTSSGQNPDGSAAIGSNTNTSQPLVAGKTAAPNLEQVSAARQANPAVTASSTAVDFVFDQAAWVSGTAGFSIVLTDGTVQTCAGPANTTTNTTAPGGGTVAGGNGTTTITVICPDETGSTTIALSQIARGVVQPGTVGSAQPTTVTGGTATACTPGTAGPVTTTSPTNYCNYLEASDSPHLTTTTPDLTTVTLQPGSASAGTTDTVIYTFDQSLAPVASGTGFGVYSANGSQIVCGSGGVTCTATQNSSNPSQVAVAFTSAGPTTTGQLAQAVGGNVQAGKVTGATTVQPNRDDEVAASNVTGTTNNTGVTSGVVNGPQLQSVTVTASKDAFGNITGFTAAYTFSQTIVASGNIATGLHLYDQNGTALTCTGATATVGTMTSTSAGNGIPSNTVTCSTFTNQNGGAAATGAQISSAVLGTADYNTVKGNSTAGSTFTANANPNPEGASAATQK